jgi:hypothetical protein
MKRMTLLACLLTVGPAHALDATFAVTNVTKITGGNEGSRILVAIPPLDLLEEELVLSARLVFPLPRRTAESEVRLRVAGLTRSWSGAATWSAWILRCTTLRGDE